MAGLQVRRLRLGLTSGAGRFSPLSLFAGGQVGAWYDPSDLATMWQDSAKTTPAVVDSPVGALDDKSGNGNHLTQVTAAARPVLRQSGSLYYLDFDGVDDCLNGGDVLDLGTRSMWAALSAAIDTTADMGIFTKTLTGSLAGRYGMTRSTGALGGFYDPSGVTAPSAAVVDSSLAARVISQKIDRTAGAQVLRINGAAVGSGGTFTPDTGTAQNTTNVFRLGAYSNAAGTSPSAFFDGKIYGLVLKLAATLLDAEIAQSERYMAGKAGVAL